MNEFADQISKACSQTSTVPYHVTYVSLDISTNSIKNISYQLKSDSFEVCNASHDRKVVWDKPKADVFKAEVQLALHENHIPEINRDTSVDSACED